VPNVESRCNQLKLGHPLGVLAARYFPQVANPLGIPALAVGVILFLIAAKGLFRPSNEAANSVQLVSSGQLVSNP